jgi:hypothetical protein
MKHYHYPTLLAAGWGKGMTEIMGLGTIIVATTKQAK